MGKYVQKNQQNNQDAVASRAEVGIDQGNVAVISLKRCRELLPDSQRLSDPDLAALRDELYALATIAVELYEEQQGRQLEGDAAMEGKLDAASQPEAFDPLIYE